MPYYEGNLVFYYYGDAEATAGTELGAQRFPDIVDAARATGQKFEDPLFPINDDSLGALDVIQQIRRDDNSIVWARPADVAQALLNGSPPIFQGNLNEFGVNQGTVGDCWFLSVLADAALKPGCINTIMPADNKTIGFDSGAFHFRLWCRGKWVDIVVDDRLPCVVVRGRITGTLFCTPTTDGGMYGQYAHIDRGSGADAMLDFAGGYIDELCPTDSNLIQKVKDYKMEDGILSFGTVPEIPEKLRVPLNPNYPGMEPVSKEGIVASHEYSFLDIQDVTDLNDPSKVTTLIRLRNPWGNATEWKGDFSDTDPKRAWDKVTPDLRIPKRDDGEFWIPFESFHPYLNVINCCRWSDRFRGDQNGKTPDGSTFFSIRGNFTISEPSNGRSDFRGKPGVYVHLKALNPNFQGEVKNGYNYNCALSLTMMYLNYTKSGFNPDIPSYGVYVLWAPGYLRPDSDEFFDNAKENVPCFVDRARRKNLFLTWPEGTALIVPWMNQPYADNSPYLLRILAEGEVYTL